MDNVLSYVFLALVGALVWLHLNRGNTDKINALKRKAKGATGSTLSTFFNIFKRNPFPLGMNINNQFKVIKAVIESVIS